MLILFATVQFLAIITTINSYSNKFYRFNTHTNNFINSNDINRQQPNSHTILYGSTYRDRESNEQVNTRGGKDKKDYRPSRSASASVGGGGGDGDLSGTSSSTGSGRASSKRKANPTRNDGIRQARISRSIRDELSEIICEGDIKATAYPEDDLLKSTCITDVEISSDLAYAKVFISVIGNSVERRQVFVWLCENVGQVRYELARRLRHMKRIPDIYFKLSDNKESSDLLSLIDQVSSSMNVKESLLNDDDYDVVEDDDEEGNEEEEDESDEK